MEECRRISFSLEKKCNLSLSSFILVFKMNQGSNVQLDIDEVSNACFNNGGCSEIRSKIPLSACHFIYIDITKMLFDWSTVLICFFNSINNWNWFNAITVALCHFRKSVFSIFIVFCFLSSLSSIQILSSMKIHT